MNPRPFLHSDSALRTTWVGSRGTLEFDSKPLENSPFSTANLAALSLKGGILADQSRALRADFHVQRQILAGATSSASQQNFLIF
jgi:hypothetical protein